jgi:tripeptidyl-peptidase I
VYTILFYENFQIKIEYLIVGVCSHCGASQLYEFMCNSMPTPPIKVCQYHPFFADSTFSIAKIFMMPNNHRHFDWRTGFNLCPHQKKMKGVVIALALTAQLSQAALFSAPQSFGAWELSHEKLNEDRLVTFKVALTAKDPAALEAKLLDVSDPHSKNFREYLSSEEIEALVAPTDQNMARAVEWLQNGGGRIIETNMHRDWLIVEAPVKSIENMFNVELSPFKNKRSGGQKIATAGTYEIPSEIDDVISLVAGMNSFSSTRGVSLGGAPEVAKDVVPQTIYTTYQTSDASLASGNKLGSQAVVEFGNFANFNYDDLQDFFTAYAPAQVGQTCGTEYGVNNGDIKASVEANLDVQYIMATGTFINTTSYKITSPSNIEDEMLNYAYIVNNETNPALVHSISYGEYGGSYDNATDHQFSNELQKMGLSGISVLLASGDNGVGCNTAGTSQEFDYPDSPYITMVGATYLDSSSGLEVGATLSSGGFSKDFMQASWQADAVNAYFKSGVTMPTQDYYAPGRAYPDVAAFGQNVQVYASGKSEAVSGTSCSAPIFAGVVALINNELLSKGMPTLGFLNPWMYANPDMFTDVLSGSNPYEKCDGFEATEGWDPVTGLGTPIYPKMLASAVSSYANKNK